jgi:hypothetical protein
MRARQALGEQAARVDGMARADRPVVAFVNMLERLSESRRCPVTQPSTDSLVRR